MPKTLNWKGYNWLVRDRVGGPDNNTFKENNVIIDANGNLALKLSKQGGIWTSAEAILETPLGHGDYVFTLASPIKYERNVVAAGFLYLNDLNEIDFEAAYWNATEPDANNVCYSVQPVNDLTKPTNYSELKIKEGVAGYKVIIHFYPNKDITVSTYDNKGNGLGYWKYTGTGEPSSEMKFFFNLWLSVKKELPAEQYFTISDFKFVPITVTPPTPPTEDLTKIKDDLIAELKSQEKLSAIKAELYSPHSSVTKVNNCKKLI